MHTVLAPDDLARRFAERVNAADVDGILRLYEPAATFVAPDGSHATGHVEIRRMVSEMLAAEPRITDVLGVESVLAGDLALMRNRWQMTFGVLAAAPATVGSSVEVARRQADGGWLYAIDRPTAHAPTN
jgi:uncharacterized protein (TIGR02246 family)